MANDRRGKRDGEPSTLIPDVKSKPGGVFFLLVQVVAVVGIATSRLLPHRLPHRSSSPSIGTRLSLSLSLVLSESCVVTVEPLSRQQVGLLGTQRGGLRVRSTPSNSNSLQRRESVSLVTGLLLVFFHPTSPVEHCLLRHPLSPFSAHYYEQLLMADGLSPRLVRRTKTIEGPEVRSCRLLPVSLDASANLFASLLSRPRPGSLSNFRNSLPAISVVTLQGFLQHRRGTVSALPSFRINTAVS